jgi:hypothetical protein
MAQVLKQYIGERFDRTGAALTAQDCFVILRDQVQDASLADQFKSILTQCEASQYAPMRMDVDQNHVDQAMALIQTIHKQIKS